MALVPTHFKGGGLPLYNVMPAQCGMEMKGINISSICLSTTAIATAMVAAEVKGGGLPLFNVMPAQ